MSDSMLRRISKLEKAAAETADAVRSASTPKGLSVRARRIQCEKHLRDFIADAWRWVEPATSYVPGWHIDAISEHLEAVTDGTIKKLLVNIPPRHMKSLQVGVFWPAWTWTTKPPVRWLFGSYSQALTIRDALKTRRLLDSPWYRGLWGDVFKLSGDQNMKSRYDNDQGGYRIATACGGGTGEGGDVLVIDDPHNIREAESETVREGVLGWFDQVWVTRRNDPKESSMVIVMQRLHQKDLSGHVLELGGWEHLCLPAEYDGRRSVTVLRDAETRTEEGALLWPERFGAKEIEELKKPLGLYGAAGQLQQRPAPRGGGMFKRNAFEIVERAPAEIAASCRAWDLAASLKGKRTAGVKWLRDDKGTLFIAHVVKGKWQPTERDQVIHQMAIEDGRGVPVLVEQEPGSGGIAQIAAITRMLEGWAVHPIAATGDKVIRADAMASQAGIGRIKIVRGEWNAEFLDELEVFPHGEYLDQVDAAAHGFNWITQYAVPVVTGPSNAGQSPRLFALQHRRIF